MTGMLLERIFKKAIEKKVNVELGFEHEYGYTISLSVPASHKGNWHLKSFNTDLDNLLLKACVFLETKI